MSNLLFAIHIFELGGAERSLIGLLLILNLFNMIEQLNDLCIQDLQTQESPIGASPFFLLILGSL